MILKLMSSNIWGDYFGNEVDYRDGQLAGIYRKYQPDVLGLQEMTPAWWASPIWEELNDLYSFVPAETLGKTNYVPMLYNHNELEVIECRFRFYHEDLDYSKGYTMAVFRHIASGKVFAVFNTHFWWQSGPVHDYARCYNAMELDQAMQKIMALYDCPVFFMGDLNCNYYSPAWRCLKKAGWVSSFAIAEESSDFATLHGDPVRGDDNHYHGVTTDAPRENSIDHIGMAPDTIVLKQQVLTEQDALDATDHSPVLVKIDL
jgi:endonuclease/exonuclease/phosphatase family metal-dependent hydrolase